MTQFEDLGDESKEMLQETGQSLTDPDDREAVPTAEPDKPAAEGGERGAGI